MRVRLQHKSLRVHQPLQVAVRAETFLAEARTVATLDHPHIVPVYDVGRSDDGSVYVVSKFIEGSDLAGHAKEAALAFDTTARLLATVAQALDHAHQKRLIHRDIKPAELGTLILPEREATAHSLNTSRALSRRHGIWQPMLT